jgi:hypothetical protein
MTIRIGKTKLSSKKWLGLALTTFLTFGFTTSIGLSASAAPRNSDKVTICHRTSAVTNPYRMITVSASSITGNSQSPNGHDNSVHNHEVDGADPGVFDPAGQPGGAYAPNQKKWEDIIPSFFYTPNGGTRTLFPGRNWTDAGRAIYYGLGNKTGLCGKTGAKEYADAEFNEWLADNPGSSDNDVRKKKSDIMEELKSMDAAEDGDLRGKSNFDDLPSEARRPPGPNRPPAFDALLTEIIAANGEIDTDDPPTSLRQALAGVVWKDMNNNGVQDDGEEVFGNLPIQIMNPLIDIPTPLTPQQLQCLITSGDIDVCLTPLASSISPVQPLFSFAGLAKDKTVFSTAANVVTLTTDANGYFEVPSLPEGDWQVNVITPDGWSYTYDSSGSSDGQMPGTYVPAGGAGFAWAGLVFVGAGGTTTGTTDGATLPKTSGLAATGNDLYWMNDAAALLIAFGGAFILMGRGRIEEEEELGTNDY